MSPKPHEYLAGVIRDGLCTRCGACVGLGAGHVTVPDREGDHLPRIGASLPEDLARRIVAGCSGREVPIPELEAAAFSGSPGADGYVGAPAPTPAPATDAAARDPYLGRVELLALAYSLDPDLRARGASGGILTTVLLWLLERGEIQGAVVTGMDPARPWRPRTYIATSPREIIEAAQSKYVITSVNEALPEMERFEGALAYVGLPCQVHSLRKLQRAGDPAVRQVRYVLGPYCGNTLHFSSIRSLLASHGLRDYRQIESLRFREGEWPGNLRLGLRSGATITLPKFHANYLIPFHIVRRCLLCTDLANELADIAGGDAWAPAYEERGKGFSIVLGRSARGVRCLRALEAAGRLRLLPLTTAEAIRMHSHGYDLKKRGAFIRMQFRRWRGQSVPDYGYQLGGFPLARYALEAVISALFALLGTRPARRALECVPPTWMGRLFVRLRTLWKRGTRRIKLHELHP